jgi:HAD superfamily hydrolase (TIGR01490 family)
MSLSIFDLDNTLLNGDSDYLWGQLLVEQGIVDGPSYEQKNQAFYDQYKQGSLDIYEFLAFSLKPLSEHPLEQLLAWRETFMHDKILPIMLDKGKQLIDEHRSRGNILMIITATNRFVTQPIVDALGVPHLLATDPEMINDQYTGKVSGIPCFQEGKVSRLQHWLTENATDLADSWFYSDSHNDIPLLDIVTHPVAVDPDPALQDYAHAKHWDIISLRDE